jgi:putative molybdopterin biosynthesis protein
VDPVEVFTPDQLAELFSLHRETIYDLIRRRELPAVKVGRRWRVRREDVEALLAGAETPPRDPRIAEIVDASPLWTDEQIDRIVAIIRADQGVAS